MQEYTYTWLLDSKNPARPDKECKNTHITSASDKTSLRQKLEISRRTMSGLQQHLQIKNVSNQYSISVLKTIVELEERFKKEGNRTDLVAPLRLSWR